MFRSLDAIDIDVIIADAVHFGEAHVSFPLLSLPRTTLSYALLTDSSPWWRFATRSMLLHRLAGGCGTRLRQAGPLRSSRRGAGPSTAAPRPACALSEPPGSAVPIAAF